MALMMASFLIHSDDTQGTMHEHDQYAYGSCDCTSNPEETTINQQTDGFFVGLGECDHDGWAILGNKKTLYEGDHDTFMIYNVKLVYCCVSVAQKSLQDFGSPRTDGFFVRLGGCDHDESAILGSKKSHYAGDHRTTISYDVKLVYCCVSVAQKSPQEPRIAAFGAKRKSNRLAFLHALFRPKLTRSPTRRRQLLSEAIEA